MITEFALAKLFESWGVTPAALVGHSMGENTAAALAGVMSFEDCIGLVLLRGRLFDTIAPGGMLSVPMAEAELRPHLGAEHDMASVNAPGLCVVSGPDAALAELAERLAAEGIETQRVAIDIAAHSRMLEPILARFGDYLRGLQLKAPQIPVISNRTGRPLTAEQAMSADYWVQHLRQTVQFRDCMATLMESPNRVFMEMGPGRALSSLAQANGVAAGQVIPALRHPEQGVADDAWHMATIARLWACGVAVDWAQVWGEGPRHRVPLPTYAFQKKPYFIDRQQGQEVQATALPARVEDLGHWGWKPHWQPEAAGFDIDDLAGAAPETWLILTDGEGLGAAVAERLRGAGHRVVTVRAGDAFAREGEGGYVLAPERGREGFDLLLRDLVGRGLAPSRILHLWLVTRREVFRPGSSFLHRNVEQGFHTLMFLAQAMAEEGLPRPVQVTCVTPEKAMVLGPARVIPREFPGVGVRLLDLALPERAGDLVGAVIEEAMSAGEGVAALRAGRRFSQGLRSVALPEARVEMPEGAHLFITGGFGGIGLTVAEDVIRRHGARVTLVARRALPDRGEWAAMKRKVGPEDAVLRRILAVERLEALGGAVLVAQADVANLEEMRAAKAAGEAQFGPVHAVIHAAGVVEDAPILAKTSAEVEDVLAPKLHGTRVLDQLFPDGSVAALVLFSSTSTITGPAGQVDYVAANEYLNAYARHRAGGRTRVVALNWGIWQGVGMAAEALAGRAGQPPAPMVPVDRPMLDEAGFDAKGNRVFTARWGHDRWVLDGHRTKDGTALIPGTGYLEVAAEAMAAQGEGTAFEMRDLTFFRALDVGPDEARPVRARLVRSEEGYAFDLQSAVRLRGRQGWLTHAQARLLPLVAPAPRLDLAAIAARLPAPERGEGLASPQEAHLAFGPRWRVVQSRSLGVGEGLAELALPAAFAGEPDQGWLLHPALMDLATGWGMGLIAGYAPDHLWVPVSYDRVQVFAPLPARVFSHMRNAAANAAQGAVARFDVTLADASGAVLVEVTGFTIRRLEGGLAFPAPDPRGAGRRRGL